MIFTLAGLEIKERARKQSFLMLMGVALLASFYFVPNQSSSFRTLIISSEKYIQADNPTWIPLATAIIAGVFLPLAGFAFCSGVISRDRKNGLYYTLTAQGMNRFSYVVGKFAASFCLLLALLGVMALGAFIMICLRFFQMPISLWAFISPFLAVVPGLAFTAAAAVLLESVPIFKKYASLGMAAFLLFHISMLVNATFPIEGFLHIFDISGYAWLHDSITSAAGEYVSLTILGGGSWISNNGTQQLVFAGLPLEINILTQKLLLLLSAGLLLLPAALLLEARLPVSAKLSLSSKEEPINIKARLSSRNTPYFSAAFGKGAILTLLMCELRRIVRELPRAWLAIQLGLFTACVFAPVEVVFSALVPIMFGAAVFPFARLGTAEHLSGMDAVLRSSHNAYTRKTIAEALAAISLSLLLSAPALIRGFILLGASSAFSLLMFAVLSPLLALAVGRLCKTPRVFELLYVSLIFVMLNAPGLIIRI